MQSPENRYALPTKSTYSWLLLTIVIAIILRWPTFFRATLSSDESTYLLMAKQWLHGLSLYTEIWDTKPPGITLLFAGLFKIWGVSPTVLRVAATLFNGVVVFTIWQILHRLHVKLSPLFIIISSLLILSTKTYSLAANTEIFFITFTLLATLQLLSAQRWWQFLFAGILLGIGFEIKYFVLFDLFALSLLLLLKYPNQRWYKLSIFGIGFLLPFSLILLYFYNSPMWQDFYYVTFIIPQKYSGTINWANLHNFIWRYMRAPGLLGILSLILIILSRSPIKKDKNIFFLIAWFVLTTIATIVPKTFFGHYIMQIIPPALLLFFYLLNNYQGRYLQKIITILIYLEVIVGGFITYNFYRKYIQQPDPEQHMASVLQQRLQPQDSIFIATTGEQILYHLLDRDIPTKYIHPSLLFNLLRAKRMGLPAKQELNRIYNLPNLKVISLDNPPYEIAHTHHLITKIKLPDHRTLLIFESNRH